MGAVFQKSITICNTGTEQRWLQVMICVFACVFVCARARVCVPSCLCARMRARVLIFQLIHARVCVVFDFVYVCLRQASPPFIYGTPVHISYNHTHTHTTYVLIVHQQLSPHLQTFDIKGSNELNFSAILSNGIQPPVHLQTNTPLTLIVKFAPTSAGVARSTLSLVFANTEERMEGRFSIGRFVEGRCGSADLLDDLKATAPYSRNKVAYTCGCGCGCGCLCAWGWVGG